MNTNIMVTDHLIVINKFYVSIYFIQIINQNKISKEINISYKIII